MGSFVKFPQDSTGKTDWAMVIGVALIAVAAVALAKRAPTLPVVGKLI